MLSTKVLANLFNLPYYDIKLKLPSFVRSDNCFGVFATIRRHEKLASYPEDIHGCIGYWDDDYKPITWDFIISKLQDVAHDAMYVDDRKSYFPDITNDPFSMVELDFMILPIIPIAASNGIINDKPFANSKYGIIATNKSSRATYLPHVFPDSMSWNELKKSIKIKAGINNNNNARTSYYGYKIKQLRVPIWSLLSTIPYSSFLFNQYIKTIENYILQFKKIPYSSKNSLKSNKTNILLIHDDKEYVRNMSVLESLLVYKYSFTDITVGESSQINLKSIILELIKNFNTDISRSQLYSDKLSSACLISLLYTWNGIVSNNKDKLPISQKMVITMVNDIANAERDFEFGQIILAGLKYSPKLLFGYITLTTILEMINDYNPTIDLIFRMNWDSQVLASLYRNLTSTGELKKVKDSIVNMCSRYINLLDSIYEQELNGFETNQIAVLFEGLYNLVVLDNKIKFPYDTYKLCFKLFRLIMTRMHQNSGLLLFSDNTARIDITVHFLDALSKIK